MFALPFLFRLIDQLPLADEGQVAATLSHPHPVGMQSPH